MGDRDDILAALRRNRPASTPLPRVKIDRNDEALLNLFISVVAEVGGKAVETTRDASFSVLEELYPGMKPVFADELSGLTDPSSLASLMLFVCEGSFGVAENGAIWLPEHQMGDRVAPFIAQHVAMLLDKTQIVQDMHRAYDRIDIAKEGFGLFVSGPSKTADIEQSLVLGAHGPRSLAVLLV